MTAKPYHPSFERLLKAASDKGVTDRGDLADLLGESTFTIANWAKRGVSKDGALIAQEKGICSAVWITSNKGDENTNAELSEAVRALKNKSDELVIPEFRTGGAMGNGLILRDQPGVIRGWSVNREWLAKNIKSHTGASNLCIVTGFGDSMKGMFNSGDPLVVDIGVKLVEYDAVYFFRVGDEGFIKRLQRIPGEGLRVLSENKRYESWTVTSQMDFEVFGRVLKAWQGEEF